MTATAAPRMEFRILPMTSIVPSKTNPRRTFSDTEMNELAESIRSIGVEQPIKVRPLALEEFEIIFGERRWRAAKLAGLTEIPAMIEDKTDAQVLEAQLVENLHRADVHPLEEAEGYDRMRKELGFTVEQIADKIGKSVEYVYTRLKLLALGKPGRDAFYRGEISPSVALLIARIPENKGQKEALEGVAGKTYREAVAFVRQRFMLDLAKAPFDVTDKTLVSDAGACGTCPFRTGSEPSLFSDVESGDVCTKIKCYQAKCDATWARRAAEAAEAGIPALEGKDAAAALPSGGVPRYGSQFVTADCYAYGCGTGTKLWGEVLKRKLPKRAAIARTPSGAAVDLFLASECKQAARELGLIPETHVAYEDTDSAEERAKRERESEALRRKDEIDREVGRLAFQDLVKRIKTKGLRDELLRHLIDAEIDQVGDGPTELLEAIGLEPEEDKDDDEHQKRFDAILKKAKGNEIASIYVAIRLQAYRAPEFDAVLSAYRVDKAKLRQKVQAECKAREKAAEEKAAADAQPDGSPEPAAAEHDEAHLVYVCVNCEMELGQHAGRKCPRGGGRWKAMDAGEAPTAAPTKKAKAKPKSKPTKKTKAKGAKKKRRKNPWAQMSVEERGERVRKMLAKKKPAAVEPPTETKAAETVQA